MPSSHPSLHPAATCQVILDDSLAMELRTQFVDVVKDLYANADPHEECLALRPIRVWDRVTLEAEKTKEKLATFPRPQVCTHPTAFHSP